MLDHLIGRPKDALPIIRHLSGRCPGRLAAWDLPSVAQRDQGNSIQHTVSFVTHGKKLTLGL
jgi:hypothetical protein